MGGRISICLDIKGVTTYQFLTKAVYAIAKLSRQIQDSKAIEVHTVALAVNEY